MLLPQTKEREYRFKLALRMGLPIFALILALISHTLIKNYTTLESSFYIESALLLLFSIYFIFYLIHSGFNVKITDDVSKTFTREYLFNYLNKDIKHYKEYTLILISIDNLSDINIQYGIKNGDKVLESVSKWVGEYLEKEKIENFPMGHIKGGDFIIGLKGARSKYTTILELMCLKSSEFKVGNIEIKISGAIIDKSYSAELDYMVEKLFELQEKTRNSKNRDIEELMTPNELESFVINAINKRDLIIMSQNVYSGEEVVFKECFIKLKREDQVPLYPKAYMKIINKLGLGIEYDLMVLEEILNHTTNITYAINISPTSLRNEKFISRTKELLEGSDKKIMFVLSEQEYYTYTSRYNSIIHALKKIGVLIAIDRVGSIHTSFLYLRELNIDLIRFDTYYSNTNKISDNRSIIDGFILMAKEKNIKSWIKNIEQNESLNIAKEMNIDYIQGKELSSLEKIYES